MFARLNCVYSIHLYIFTYSSKFYFPFITAQFKETFYHALDHKLPKLNDLRNILSELVHYLDTHLKNRSLKLRNSLTDEAKTAWESVIRLIEKLESNSKKGEAVPVFHTMNLHMGLQLFSDPQMAVMAINELQSCYERLVKKSKKSKAGIKKDEDEPEWVEVVVDLLLSFYSKNSHLLRSLVGCVFPHICTYVTPTAIHQILAVCKYYPIYVELRNIGTPESLLVGVGYTKWERATCNERRA